MTIRTEEGAYTLDAGNWQFTHQGVTVGLHLSYTNSIAGHTSAITAAERVGANWEQKGLLAMNFGNELEAMGVVKWIEAKLLPAFNVWLARRFAAAPNPAPPPVPNWVPEQIVELDAALLRLKVAVVNGVPQVSI